MMRKLTLNTCVKYSIASIVFVFFQQTLAWANDDNFHLRTQYQRGTFETEASMVSKAPPEIILDIKKHLHRLEIDALQWATKGLLLSEEDDDSRNLIQIEYRGVEYDSTTGIFDFLVDVHFRRRVFENIRISVLVEGGEDLYGHPFIRVELQNPNFFLRGAEGLLTIEQTENKRQFVVRSSVRFAWFFSLFITTANYNAVAEWRIQTLLENLNAEANRR